MFPIWNMFGAVVRVAVGSNEKIGALKISGFGVIDAAAHRNEMLLRASRHRKMT